MSDSEEEEDEETEEDEEGLNAAIQASMHIYLSSLHVLRGNALDTLAVAFMTFLHILNGVMHQYRSLLLVIWAKSCLLSLAAVQCHHIQVRCMCLEFVWNL